MTNAVLLKIALSITAAVLLILGAHFAAAPPEIPHPMALTAKQRSDQAASRTFAVNPLSDLK